MTAPSGLACWMRSALTIIRHEGYRHWKNSAKFIARSLMNPFQTLRFCRFMHSQTELAAWAGSQPSIFFKPQRPYLHAGLGMRQRVDHLIGHYRFFCLRFPEEIRRKLLFARSVTIASVPDVAVGSYFVTLERRDRFDKEGEIVARLYRGDRRLCLCSMAFTIGPEPAPRLTVGCILGADYRNAQFDIRIATRSLEGLRPANFLFETVRRLAWSLGISSVVGVGRQQHIYRRTFLKRSTIRFDYDQFWKEYGAVPEQGLYGLQTSPKRLDPSRHPSKKRAMIRRRQCLLDSVRDQIAHRFGPAAPLARLESGAADADATAASERVEIEDPNACAA